MAFFINYDPQNSTPTAPSFYQTSEHPMPARKPILPFMAAPWCFRRVKASPVEFHLAPVRTGVITIWMDNQTWGIWVLHGTAWWMFLGHRIDKWFALAALR